MGATPGVDPFDPTAPDVHDLIAELRTAVGLFAGAMPISPKQAWDEAVAVARRAVQERDTYEAALLDVVRAAGIPVPDPVPPQQADAEAAG